MVSLFIYFCFLGGSSLLIGLGFGRFGVMAPQQPNPSFFGWFVFFVFVFFLGGGGGCFDFEAVWVLEGVG